MVDGKGNSEPCLHCQMLRERHPLSYCANYICKHNSVAAGCHKCLGIEDKPVDHFSPHYDDEGCGR